MRRRVDTLLVALVAFGGLALAVALVAIVDLALPRPWDGVVLEGDAPGTLAVREVVAGSGAARAGIRPGDRIVGIDRDLLRSPTHAAELLARRTIGETVPYLVARDGAVAEVGVELGPPLPGQRRLLLRLRARLPLPRRSAASCWRASRRQRAAQVFFLVCVLFLLFLVCRLRPVSYTLIDRLALDTGTFALLFLPACFLHFFLIFPRPVALRPAAGAPRFAAPPPALAGDPRS